MSLTFITEDDQAPGQVTEIAPGVRRLLCGNPGPFTGKGTNTWIIGEGEVAILDPGPVDEAHLAAILKAVQGERISHILVSHTHRDHSPGVAALRAATRAPSLGFGPHLTPPDQGGEGGDHDFLPDQPLHDGALIEGRGWRLRALHTPGHCANHLCFALEGTGMLFSADHVMSWSTTVVSPPDGDMADYMGSLDKLLAVKEDRLYLPGHGAPLPEPRGFVEGLKAHRLAREARVLEALAAHPGGTALDLVRPVYGPGLAEKLVPAAARSLLAHLIKLESEGHAISERGHWRAV
ncbi:MBL fold metallo-hydrolase [Acetobacteraceae bacterium H6797]|nr:MBL fold metallo-hydrolase [Acetobacteraceae bacterium H6797]